MQVVHTSDLIVNESNNKVILHINEPQVITDRIITNNTRLGIFMAETCARYMNKFIPMDTGMLSQNFITKPFKVIYNSPYAHRVFFGEHFNFSKEQHPLATARWDIACGRADGNRIAKEINSFMRRN